MESVHHGTFLPLIAPESVCFRGLPISYMQRNRYDRPPYCNGNGIPPALNCPCPCHGNGTLCNPLNPRNLLQPFEHVGLVGKWCALVSGGTEGAKSVSHWHPDMRNSLILLAIRFHTSHNIYNAKSANGNPTNPIEIEIEGAGEGRKGAGSCPQIVQSGTG